MVSYYFIKWGNIWELDSIIIWWHGLVSEEYIQSYRYFCMSLEFEYKESLEVMEKQSEEFEKDLSSLE